MEERREVDIDINYIINQLKKKYEEDLVDALILHNRYDLLAGFILTEKRRYFDDAGKLRMVVVNKDGTISIRRQYTVKYGKKKEEEIFMHREADGEVLFMIKDYSAFSKKLESVYNKKIAGKNIQPDYNWKESSAGYVGESYLGSVAQCEDFMVENADAWECLAFVSRVPYANVERFEDLIIDQNNVALLFALATDVQGANIEKIRKAMLKVGSREDIFRFNSIFKSEEKMEK